MSTQVKLRRGTSLEHETFTGASAELTVDTTEQELVLHDGVTQGGKRVGIDKVKAVNSVADLAGFAGKKDDQQISLKGWHPDSDVGGGILYWDAAKPKSEHNGGTVFSPTVPFSATTGDYLDGVGETDAGGSGCWVREDSDYITPSEFGAVRNTDATKSIQSIIDGLNNVTIRISDDFLSSGLTVGSNKSLTIDGEFGNLTTVDGFDGVWLSAVEDTTLVLRRVTIDGNGELQRAIETQGNLNASYCNIHNLYSSTLSAVGIYLDYSSSLGRTGIVRKCNIYDISGVTTNPTGSSAGSARAIMVRSPSTTNSNCNVDISHNTLKDIYGREGDIIHCFDSLPSGAGLSDSVVKIRENLFGGSNRRAIKIQGGNVHVIKNTFVTIDQTHPEFGRDGQGGAGIISIGQNGPTQEDVMGNRVVGNLFYNNGGIKASVITNYQFGTEIKNNTHNSEYFDFCEIKVACNFIDVVNNTANGVCGGLLGYSGSSNITFKNNVFNVASSKRSLFDDITFIPDKTIFSGNTIKIHSDNTETFDAVFRLSGAAQISTNSSVISGNSIVTVGPVNTTKCALLFINNDVTMSGVTFENNTTTGYKMFSRAQFATDITDNVFSNNKTWQGVDEQPIKVGRNIVKNSYFTNGVSDWTLTTYDANEQAISVIGAGAAAGQASIAGLVAGTVYALDIDFDNKGIPGVPYAILQSGDVTVPLEEGKKRYFYTHAGDGTLLLSGTNANADLSVYSIEVRGVL